MYTNTAFSEAFREFPGSTTPVSITIRYVSVSEGPSSDVHAVPLLAH
jgi:hypothetical protein